MRSVGVETGGARSVNARSGARRGRGALAVLVGAAALASCGATAAPSAAPAPATAAAACLASLGAGWKVAVESDRPDAAVLALVSGDSVATCQTRASRTGPRAFDDTATGVGTYPFAPPPVLSYLTGGGSGGETAFLVGRLPRSAAVVRLTLAGGTQQDAALGGGLWLAWLQQPSEATAIVALDASGKVLSRLADPNGLQPAG